MSKRLASLILVACCLSPALAQEKPDAKVELTKITEHREKALVKENRFSGFGTGVELNLRVTGKDVDNARSYGDIKITKAVDDLGTDLSKSEDDDTSNSRMQQVSKFGMDEKEQGFRFDLNLPTLPPRKAKSIKLVEGTVKVVAGGTKKLIEVPIKPEQYGKPVDDPALKELGVTFTLTDPKAKKNGFMMGGGDNSVPATISGNREALAEVTVVDGAGEEISNGSMWNDQEKTREVSYFVNGKLPDGAKVRIEVWPGQKTLTVPFKFENIELP